MLRLAQLSEHVVILSDHEKDDEEADMETVFLLLHLRDIRTRHELSFNITTEMRRESNQDLVVTDDHTDFVVASNMSALVLAQLSESPELIGAFSELLSNQGNELFLRNAGDLGCAGSRTTAEIRSIAFASGYIVLGYMDPETGRCSFNPPLDGIVELEGTDRLIVLGES